MMKKIKVLTILHLCMVWLTTLVNSDQVQRQTAQEKNKHRFLKGQVATSDAKAQTKAKAKGKGSDGSTSSSCSGKIIVANRDDGTLSILDGRSGDLFQTVDLPYKSSQSQPIPVDVVAINGIVYVGDQANDQVIVLDGSSYNIIQYIPTGAGIVQIATDARGKYLWVANDGDATVNIIDLEYFVPIRSITSSNLGVPSGVVVDPAGDYGYVTYSGESQVVAFKASDGSNSSVYNFANDVQYPALSFRFPSLYVPSTSGNVIYDLYIDFNTDGISLTAQLDVEGPYATTVSPDGGYLYFTLPSSNEIGLIDIVTDSLSGNRTTTPSGPQQLVHTGSRLFVTHTDSDRVSFYAANSINPKPVLLGTVNVGSSPDAVAFSKPPNSCL